MEAIRTRPKPKRLVYAPKAYVFIHSRKLGKTIDVSDYVVSGAVNRVVNQPSTAVVTLKNPDFKWINGSKGKRKRFDPAFLPMDGITIWLQRIAGKPIQVFTGYVDEIPIYQMYPENLEIKATCTLKRLLYTYFDPGTAAMTDFFVKHNWNWDPNNGLAFSSTVQDGDQQGSGNNVPDSGMGEILKSFLIEVCHWDPQAVVIADLPKGVPDMVSRLWAQKVQISEAGYKDLQSFFSNFLTMSTGSTSDSISGSSGVVANKATIREIKNIMGDLKNSPTELPSNSAATGTSMLRPSVYDIFLASMVMTRVNKNYSNNTAGIQNGTGMFAIPKDFIMGDGGSGGSQGRPQATTDYKGDITGSIKYFMTKYNEMVTSHGAAGKTSEEKIALTLSFGMGKEQFYADILKACQSDTNRSIAQGLSNTTQADTTSSTATAQNVLTAAEVRTKTNHSRVNWNQLMSGGGKANAEDYTSGSALIKNKTYKVKAEFFEDTPDAVIFDETLKKTISVDLNSLGYFIIEYGRNPASQRYLDSGNLGHLPFGAKIRVTNPANGNSAVALVMDAATNTGAEMGMSRNLATSIGLMSVSASSFSGDANIEYLGDDPFKEDDLKDKSGNTYPVKRKSIIAKSKTLGPGASKKQFLTINEADHDAYKAYYKQKETSEILAEYFFVANDMGLRLAIPQETSSNLVLLVQNDNPNQGSNALKQYATWASSQEGIKYVGYSDDTNLYKYSRGSQASSTSLKSTSSDRGNHIGPDLPEIYTYQTVVQIDQNAPHPIYDGDIVVDPTTTDTTATKTDVTWQDLVKLNISAAFTTMFSLPVNTVESRALTGDKALMNDIPVYQGVQQFVLGSMRQFMSLPNGQFCAFYPDQFGTLGRTPYWNMYDVEIEDLKINLNDTELITHMYVNGPTNSSGNQPINFADKIASAGVVTIEDAISVGGFITSLNDVNPKSGTAAGSSKEKLKETFDFLQTFGARPFVKDEPLIRNHYFEFITAYNLFQYHWSQIHATTAKVSFQPELIAGGIVAFPDHALNLYVEQVSHSWDYSAGFQTQAVFSCPSTQNADENPGLVIFNYGQQK